MANLKNKLAQRNPEIEENKNAFSVEKNGIEKEGITKENVAAYKTDRHITYPLTQYNASAIKRWKELQTIGKGSRKVTSVLENKGKNPVIKPTATKVPFQPGMKGKIVWEGKNKFVLQEEFSYDGCKENQDDNHPNPVTFDVDSGLGVTNRKTQMYCDKPQEGFSGKQSGATRKSMRGRNKTYRRKPQSRKCRRGYN